MHGIVHVLLQGWNFDKKIREQDDMRMGGWTGGGPSINAATKKGLQKEKSQKGSTEETTATSF